MTKPATIDESNLIGTGAEETHWYKNSPAKDDECEFWFLNYCTVKSIKKGEWMCYQKRNVWYNKTCVGAKG